MFWVMLRQSFLRARKRKALAVLTVTLSASLITALMTISLDVGDKMTRELKSYGANIQVVPKSEKISLEIGGVDYNPLKGKVFLEERYLPAIKDIFWRNNIVGFAPFLKLTVRIAGKENGRIPLTGTYFDKQLPVPDEDDFHTGVRETNPFWKVRGEWPRDDQPFEALAGGEIAKVMGWNPGDQVTVITGESKRVDFEIKGILVSGGREEKGLVVPLRTVQDLGGLTGKVESISVSALTVPENVLSRKARRDPEALDTAEYDLWYCTAYVSSIAYQIAEAVPNSSVRPVWQVAEGEGAVIRKIQMLMAVVTLAAFFASTLGISSIMSTLIMERSREIGLIKALGAADWEVYLLFHTEAAVVGGLGGLLGCAVGLGFSQIIGLGIFGSGVPFNPVVVPVVLAVSVLIALAGSTMPSRLITRVYPAEVLHGRR